MSILKETIKNVVGQLLEGRLEDVKAKYGEDMSNIIDNLSQGDPSGNNKYLSWMAKVYQDTPQTDQIIKAVTEYHNGIQKLNSNFTTPIVDSNKGEYPGRAERRVKNNPKDIMGYPSLNSLKLVVDALEETKKERPDRDRIYQDDRWTVVVPKTHEAACKYGRHSNWCVSTANSSYFGSYTKDRDALLFFILWRNKRNVEDKTEYKVAINARFREWENPKSWNWYDMPDRNLDPELMLNVLPHSMIEKIQKYLVGEGKRQGKIIDSSQILKMINDNAKVVLGEHNEYVYLLTDDLTAFSSLPGYSDRFRWRNPEDYNSRNSVVYINKTQGDFNYGQFNTDLWGEGYERRNRETGEYYTEPPALGAYKSWKRNYSGRQDFVNYVMNLPNEIEVPGEIREEIESKAREDLTPIGGMWVETRTTGLNVGDTVRWKKGRGWYDQRYNQWNNSIIDRQTPSGYFVTGKTDEYPKGKRFKPSRNTSMDVYHEFGDNIDLSSS
jgi:hypothetical protein